MKYVYSTIRFVPDPGRGECVNVGVIVGGESPSEWRIRIAENFKRAKALDDQHALPALRDFVDGLQELMAGDLRRIHAEEGDRVITLGWLEDLHRVSQNIVQFSPPTPVVAKDADSALSLVFQELVVDPGSRVEATKGKRIIIQQARAAYRKQGIKKGEHLEERQTVQTAHYEQIFDFAVANGRVVQLTQAWSFQRRNEAELIEDLKAWAWNVNDLRKSGGAITTKDGGAIDVLPDVDIVALYLPPSSPHLQATFREARDVLEEVGVASVPVSEANIVSTHAHELLASHKAQLPLFGTR